MEDAKTKSEASEAVKKQKKADLEAKVRDRVACESKAFDIVNRLIEPDITEDFFLNACKFIDHSHYDDIVEERSIVRLCGYPVCSNLMASMPKKKYHISTRTNTVFEISERKKFCSNECYRASCHLKKQIPATPVWTRRNHPATPFRLLHTNVKSDKPCTQKRRSFNGEEVIGMSEVIQKPLSSGNRQQEGESKAAYLMRLLDKQQKLFAKVADIQENETKGSESSKSSSSHQDDTKKDTLTQSKSERLAECSSTESERQSLDVSNKNQSESGLVSEKPEQLSNSRISQVSKENEHQTVGVEKAKEIKAKQTRSKAKTKGSQQSSAKVTSPVDAVCRIISDWFTPETLQFLGVGTSERNADKETTPSSFHKDPKVQQKYMELCQRLAGQEKDVDDFLGEEVDMDGEGEEARRPVPDMEELRRQTKDGKDRFSHFIGQQVFDDRKKKKAAEEAEDNPRRDRPVVLPVIDSQNQLLIRRRIVLERLHLTMPSLLPPLGLSLQDISTSLRELIFTFSLSSHNIVFKPVEWTLVAILLLRVLAAESAPESAPVAGVFESPARCATLNTVLSHLGHSCTSLATLVNTVLLAPRQQQTVENS